MEAGNEHTDLTKEKQNVEFSSLKLPFSQFLPLAPSPLSAAMTTTTVVTATRVPPSQRVIVIPKQFEGKELNRGNPPQSVKYWETREGYPMAKKHLYKGTLPAFFPLIPQSHTMNMTISSSASTLTSYKHSVMKIKGGGVQLTPQCKMLSTREEEYSLKTGAYPSASPSMSEIVTPVSSVTPRCQMIGATKVNSEISKRVSKIDLTMSFNLPENVEQSLTVAFPSSLNANLHRYVGQTHLDIKQTSSSSIMMEREKRRGGDLSEGGVKASKSLSPLRYNPRLMRGVAYVTKQQAFQHHGVQKSQVVSI